MPLTAFHAPETIEQAVALLSGDAHARPLAGGTDLIVQIQSRRIEPGAIVDLKRIEALSGIGRDGDGFVIGATTPCTALKEDVELASAWPGIVEAANLIGSVQVRNRATMAGNLCNASPAADSVPALVASDATCVIAGPTGQRDIPVGQIPIAPGQTSLKPGEIVTAIKLPPRGKGCSDAYLRSTPRTEMDIAVVGAGANIVLDTDGTCISARIAIGAAAPTVVLVEAAGKALEGTKIDEAALDAMAQAVRDACNPINDKRGTAEYRIAMAGVLAKRTVTIARGRAGETL